jgi:hypothetical protein
MVDPTPHGHTNSLLIKSCNFPLSRICTSFYLEAYPYALKMVAIRSSEMPVRFYQSITYIMYQKTIVFIVRPCEPYSIPKLIPVSNFILICIHRYRKRHVLIFR